MAKTHIIGQAIVNGLSINIESDVINAVRWDIACRVIEGGPSTVKRFAFNYAINSFQLMTYITVHRGDTFKGYAFFDCKPVPVEKKKARKKG